MVNHVVKELAVSHNVKELPYDLAIPILAIYPKLIKMYVSIKTCT